MLAHQRGKGGLGVVAFEQRGHFDGLGRFIKLRAGCRHLQAPHHVAANDGQQSDGAGANVRAKLLLQHLQQVALGQVHLQHGRELVVPHVAFQPHGHGEGDKVVCSNVRVVGEHAFEVAGLFERGHFAAEHVDGHLHYRLPVLLNVLGASVALAARGAGVCARSRRSSSRLPA